MRNHKQGQWAELTADTLAWFKLRATHQHNTNGATTWNTIRIGKELITYKDVRCSCGHTIDRVVVLRNKEN